MTIREEDVLKSVLLLFLAVICAVALVSGCTTSRHGDVPAPIVDTFEPVAGIQRRAVAIGMTYVAPAAYGGWDGACPAANRDAAKFAALLRFAGFQVAELRNADATKAGLVAAMQTACLSLKPLDLFVLYYSGHGSQVKDTNADETDGRDETLCLWDGEVTDDVMVSLWQQVPPGVRVLFVSDACNSGSSFKVTRKPPKVKRPAQYKGQLIHFGSCDDGQTAYSQHGLSYWTAALLRAWSPAVTYRQWFDAAAARMPGTQRPVWAEYGAVDPGFRDGAALK
jgi:hypothetical protein